MSGHKKLWSNFKVEETEPLGFWEELPEKIDELEHPTIRSLKWVCFGWEDVKNSKYLEENYRKMLLNFERERDAYDEKEGFDRMWFFFSTTFKPGMQESGKFYPVGFVGIQEDEKTNNGTPTYQIAWLHPFMRGYGFMKYLCYHLAKQNAYAMEPPVSVAMQFAMVNATNLLSKSEIDSLRDKTRIVVQKRHNIDLSKFTNDEFEKMASLLNILPEDEINQKNVDQFLKIFRDPKFMNEMENIFPKALPKSERAKMIKEYNMRANLKAKGEDYE